MVGEGGVAAFGEQLRREREVRGVDVEAICDATKVPMRHIRALEAGDLGELPGGVFRRGFVRSYLRALGLEEGSWMERFEESCRESGVGDPANGDWSIFAEYVRNSRRATRHRGRLRWVSVAGIVAILGLAGWCGWRLETHQSLLPGRLDWDTLKSWVDNAASR